VVAVARGERLAVRVGSAASAASRGTSRGRTVGGRGATRDGASRPSPRRGHAATAPRRAATGPRTRFRALQRGANVGIGSRAVMGYLPGGDTDRAWYNPATEPN
jgi:hypothetical protein